MCKYPISPEEVKNCLFGQRMLRIKALSLRALKSHIVSKRGSQTEILLCILLWVQLWILLHCFMRANSEKLGGAKIKPSVTVKSYMLKGWDTICPLLYDILKREEQMLLNRRSASVFSVELLSISRIPWSPAAALESFHIKWQVTGKREV